jgi:PhzF family phenazine biosynthesis protein
MIPRRNWAVLKVFGRQEDCSSGNAATVIWLEKKLKPSEMASIAHDANTPVSVFLAPGRSLQAHFFTSISALPFCGHGALAAGVAEAMRCGRDSASFAADGREVTVECAKDGLAYLVVPADGAVGLEPHPEPLLEALGLSVGDLAKSVTVASVGSPKWLVNVRDLEILRTLRPEMEAILALSRAAGINGAYVYAANPTASLADVIARGFNPKGGVPEDAATGAAAAALAWSERDELRGRWLVIDQGIGLEHLNRIHVRVHSKEIHLGGHVVLIKSSCDFARA